MAITSSDTPTWAACLCDEDGVFVFSRHLTLEGAREKCRVKVAEMTAPEVGTWSVYVACPDGTRTHVAGTGVS
jgi:hypothetical protein